MTTKLQQHQKYLCSATLKAEAERIRFLRNKRKRLLAFARNPKTPDNEADRARGQAHDLKWATVCPSERARCALLALAYLKGMPYRQVEASTRTSKHELYGRLAKEIAKKAEASHDDIVEWFYGPMVKEEAA